MTNVYAATTLDQFVALVRQRLKASPGSLNEADLHEWCFQRWHGGKRKGGFADSTITAFAREYDRHVGRGLRSDRHRKPGPKGD